MAVVGTGPSDTMTTGHAGAEPLIAVEQRRPGTTISCWSQWRVLLYRKELPLKRNRLCVSFWEIAMPTLLCFTMWLGASMSGMQHAPDTQYAPKDVDAALGSLGPFAFAVSLGVFRSPEDDGGGAAILPSFLPNASVIDALLSKYSVDTRTPTAILPLPLFLTYSWLLQSTGHAEYPPFDGSVLAVTPDTWEVRVFIERVLNRPIDDWVLAPGSVLGEQIHAFVSACNLSLPQTGSSSFIPSPSPQELRDEPWRPSPEELRALAQFLRAQYKVSRPSRARVSPMARLTRALPRHSRPLLHRRSNSTPARPTSSQRQRMVQASGRPSSI